MINRSNGGKECINKPLTNFKAPICSTLFILFAMPHATNITTRIAIDTNPYPHIAAPAGPLVPSSE